MDPTLPLIARVGLALLFVAAAVPKIRDGAAFRVAVAEYRLVPATLVAAAAAATIATELATAALLAVPASAAVGALVAAALLVVYAGAIAINLARGRRDIDCGCGFGGRQPLGAWLVVRNLVLAGAALATPAVAPSRALHWVDAVTVVGAVAALGALHAAASALAANVRVRGVA
jgi:methylamine utilization protein MauE